MLDLLDKCLVIGYTIINQENRKEAQAMYTHITIDNTTHEFRTDREAKDYLFQLLEQHPSPSHTRQSENQLDRLLNINTTKPQDINASFIKSINH
jgi:hypothetical protein